MNVKALPTIEKLDMDKILHAAAYFGLVVVWFLYFFAKSTSTKVFSSVTYRIGGLSVVFGIVVEFLQMWITSYRTWDIFDMIANFVGVFMALVLLFAFRRILKNLKMKI